MAKNYPLVNFHFRVTGWGSGVNDETAFREVTGLTVQFQSENLKEGGVNSFDHTIPTRATYPGITLKRGVMTRETGTVITTWLKNAFENFQFEGKDLTIQLLNEESTPIVQWKVIHALPKSWKFSDLNAERGEVFIESIELSMDHFVYEML